MRTLAALLILVAIAASRRSRGVLLWDQPHHWPAVTMAASIRMHGK